MQNVVNTVVGYFELVSVDLVVVSGAARSYQLVAVTVAVAAEVVLLVVVEVGSGLCRGCGGTRKIMNNHRRNFSHRSN